MQPEIPLEKRITEFLANERTFLAWIRTCIAVISLGFVIARFGVWLREFSARIDPASPATLEPQSTGFSLFAGVAMMALGSALAILAAFRYRAINRAIEKGQYEV